MGILYNRFVEVRFLDRNRVVGGRMFYDGNAIVHPNSIEFYVNHSSESSPNSAEISILNLSSDTQRQILIEGDRVELEAGYWPQDGARTTGVIFRGQIRSVLTKKSDQTNTRVKILLGDGDYVYAHSRIRHVFQNPTHKQIVESIASQFESEGLKIGKIDVPDFTETRPRTVDRLGRRELDDIAYQHDLQWYIQDGEFNMYPRDEPLKDSAYYLSPDSGVVGSPEFTEVGVNVRTLMIPDLRPGFTFLLKNDKLNRRVSEECKIDRITFRGNNYAGQFGCEITSRFIKSGAAVRARERLIGAVT